MTVRLGLADLPIGASWPRLLGVSLLCGVGLTANPFIGMLAFAGGPALQDEVRTVIVGGSILAGLPGWGVFRVAPREVPPPAPGC